MMQSNLPRKFSKSRFRLRNRGSRLRVGTYCESNRTANRHRCSARVEQGERVRRPQGTRQKSSRNFGIRLASIYLEAAAKVSLATVYQKHSSLRTRKRMYRG